MRGIVTVVLFIAFACAARAETDAPSFNAGVIRLTVADQTAPIDTVVFYPTRDRETAWQAGPFLIEATRNAAPIADRRFPVVLLSHGRRGGPLSHRELATALARAGFIVILPTHVGDAYGSPPAPTQSRILIDRPRQAEASLNAVLTDTRFSASVDENRIGMIGFSAGGYTALILAGAKPDFRAAVAYCSTHDDPGSCPRRVAQGGTTPVAESAAAITPELAAWKPPLDRRVKALVLMDPLAVMFDASALSAVRVPTLLYRPQNDAYLGSAVNALAVATGLQPRPQMEVVPGNHFVFIDPCPDSIALDQPMVCQDAPGVDRAQIHRQIEHEVVSFLREHL